MKKYILLFLGVSGILGIILAINIGTVSANPSYASYNNIASASTTLVFMTPGAGTTTQAFDVQAENGALVAVPDSAILAIQFNASSTASVLNWRYEYGLVATSTLGTQINCQANQASCDWYEDDMFTNDNSTTTQQFLVGARNSYSWTFASSTIGGVAAGTGLIGIDNGNSRNNKLVVVPTPTRYFRVVWTCGTATGAQNCGVYSTLVLKKQNR